ncbi:ABC transporter ATP-binding protein [Pseudocitrobacter cyperus]|uniref:ABC transporter ATP-binding protein n=1 Tax=Pseudocitrobacter cyperus TaxID=3112843 RepID=A0ABV0HEK4_9ENTR
MMDVNTSPAIRVADLTLRYGAKTVFEKLNIDIPAGRFVSLLGASGAGKTSLLRIVAGLLSPTSGTVTDDKGRPLSGRIAWMGQRDLLYPWLTIEQNVCLGSRLRGEKADRERAQYLLERVGLSGCGASLPETLSGGMRQRAAIARTLYEQQPIVLMDEPFSALDAITRATIQTMAAELLADRTVLLITHDPAEACRLSHKILVLSQHPGGIDDTNSPDGSPPRQIDDPAVIQSQSALMRLLTRSTQ